MGRRWAPKYVFSEHRLNERKTMVTARWNSAAVVICSWNLMNWSTRMQAASKSNEHIGNFRQSSNEEVGSLFSIMAQLWMTSGVKHCFLQHTLETCHQRAIFLRSPRQNHQGQDVQEPRRLMLKLPPTKFVVSKSFHFFRKDTMTMRNESKQKRLDSDAASYASKNAIYLQTT